ncbi:acyl carrier protein [Rhodococcus opacus]|uniref:acyl carrier protein n=1 Tax=Rhodococcus opacus TaxID=37919 RepID=UPI001F5160FE|nr:acyl carrier protein [Rhodococcus opacus]
MPAVPREPARGHTGIPDPNADFDRLGLDSPLAVSLLIEIEERYGVDLPPEELFENPTLDAVGEYVHQHLRQDVA